MVHWKSALSLQMWVLLLAVAPRDVSGSHCVQHLYNQEGLNQETAYERCFQLYQILETALTSNATNLFKLQDTVVVSPWSGFSAAIVWVNYSLSTINNSSPDMHYYSVGWSRGPMFSLISPMLISALQPTLIGLIFSMGISPLAMYADSLLDSQGCSNRYECNISLWLNIATLPNCTDGMIEATLDDMTQWLRGYAQGHLDLSAMTSTDRDYTVLRFSVPITDFIITVDVLLVVLVWLFLARAGPSLHKKQCDKMYTRSTPTYHYYWGVVVVAGSFNVSLITSEVVLIVHSKSSQTHNVQTWLKLAVIMLLAAFNFIPAVSVHKDKLAKIPRSISFLGRIACCFCTYGIGWRKAKSCWSWLIQTAALWTILTAITFLVISITPTILWTILFPAYQTFATLAFTAAIVFCLVIIMAFFFSVENCSDCHGEQLTPVRNCVRWLAQLCFVILSTSALLLFYAMYIVVFARSLESSNLSSLIASILPTAILTITGWYVQRQLLFKKLDSLIPGADSANSANMQSSTGTIYHSMQPEAAPLISPPPVTLQ